MRSILTGWFLCHFGLTGYIHSGMPASVSNERKKKGTYPLTRCKSTELASILNNNEKQRQGPGRDGKILSDHRQDGNVRA